MHRVREPRGHDEHNLCLAAHADPDSEDAAKEDVEEEQVALTVRATRPYESGNCWYLPFVD
jgi:hypothetical protein